jgi:hypothetical protein
MGVDSMEACRATAAQILALAASSIAVMGMDCFPDADTEFTLQPVSVNGHPHYCDSSGGIHMYWTPSYEDSGSPGWVVATNVDAVHAIAWIIWPDSVPFGTIIWAAEQCPTNARLSLTPTFSAGWCGNALSVLSPTLPALCCQPEDGPSCGQLGNVPVDCSLDCALQWGPVVKQCQKMTGAMPPDLLQFFNQCVNKLAEAEALAPTTAEYGMCHAVAKTVDIGHCHCAGVTSVGGSGGSSCMSTATLEMGGGKYCYTDRGVCKDGMPSPSSSSMAAYEGSFLACGNSCEPTRHDFSFSAIAGTRYSITVRVGAVSTQQTFGVNSGSASNTYEKIGTANICGYSKAGCCNKDGYTQDECLALRDEVRPDVSWFGAFESQDLPSGCLYQDGSADGFAEGFGWNAAGTGSHAGLTQLCPDLQQQHGRRLQTADVPKIFILILPPGVLDVTASADKREQEDSNAVASQMHHTADKGIGFTASSTGLQSSTARIARPLSCGVTH